MNRTATSATIDEEEIRKFTSMADEWWNPAGKFKPLHNLNPVRLAYIRNAIEQHILSGKKKSTAKTPPPPLKGITILDVGCGGGLICEPLAQLGAEVTGIDAGEENIRIASLHARKTGVNITYRHDSVEHLADEDKRFDVVLNLEVLEHVADVNSFLHASAKIVKPGGIMIMATLNRTVKSYALGIVGAEYILRWLPRGTHDWHKFLKPSEIYTHLEDTDITVNEVRGVSYHPVTDSWSLSDDTAVNYLMLGKKVDNL